MGGEALGPEKAGCGSQCRGMPGQGSRSEWVGEQGKGRWARVFSEGKTERDNM